MLDCVVAAPFQDIERAGDVAPDVGVRRFQRIAHAGLRGQVHYTRELLLCEQLAHRLIVGEIELDEAERRQLLQLRQPRLLQRDVVVVVEVVEADDLMPAGKQAPGGVKSDEPGGACQQIFHRRPSVCAAGNTCLMSYST